MLKDPIVSVCIPVYGTEAQLPRALESVLASIPDPNSTEIIVVDDRSPDRASEVIRSFEAQYSNIKLIQHEQNQGLPYARQTAVDEAKGRYILHFDSDDVMVPGALDAMVKAATDANADIVQSLMQKVTENKAGQPVTEMEMGLVTKISPGILRGQEIIDALGHYWSKNYLQYRIWGKLFRRALWQTCQPLLSHHRSLGEDVLFNAQLCQRAEIAVTVDQVGTLYVLRGDSHMGSSWDIAQYETLFKNGSTFEHLLRIGPRPSAQALNTYTRDILTDLSVARIKSTPRVASTGLHMRYLHLLSQHSHLFAPEVFKYTLNAANKLLDETGYRESAAPILSALERLPLRSSKWPVHVSGKSLMASKEKVNRPQAITRRIRNLRRGIPHRAIRQLSRVIKK